MTGYCLSKTRLLATIFFLAAITVAAVGCQGAPPRISIENASAEFSPALYGEGLVYLTIKNAGGKDTLTGVKIDISGATADFHEMRGGVMVINKRVTIPAQGAVVLAPSQSHIMIENIPRSLKEGSSFTLTLVFERSGEKQVPLTFKKARMSQMPMTLEHR